MSKDWKNIFEEDLVVGNTENEVEDDFYSILGVDKSSSLKEIKKAYRDKAKKVHPDKHPENERKKYKLLFQKLSQAYTILSNPNTKQVYDDYGMDGVKNRNFVIPQSEEELQRLFDMVFDDYKPLKNTYVVLKPQCQPIHKIITLEKNYIDTVKYVTYEKTKLCTKHSPRECDECDGKGYLFCRPFNWICGENVKKCAKCLNPITSLWCPMCDWAGYVEVQTKQLTQYQCSKCRGKKKICQCCQNTGVTRTVERQKVLLKKNIKHNEQLTLFGVGNEKYKYENGDVIITFKINNFTHESNENKKPQPPECKQM